MSAFRSACARGRAGTSRSRTQGAACAGGTGKPEDEDPAKFMCAIRVCGDRKVDISALLEPLEAREDRDGVALAHLHDRLLPRAGLARRVAAPLGLGLDGCRAHVD